ncbi:MAG: hypothetical protein M3O88_02390 [Actinomycetota bacterium]|nr:hypothetical protein [Actinomycetota bacterium]
MRRTPDRPDMGRGMPPPLRFASFVTTSVGGALVGLGSLLTWAEVGVNIPGANGSGLSSNVHGVDTAEGKIALVLGFVLLVGGVAMRALTAKGLARVVGWLVVISSLIAAGIGVLDIVRADHAFDLGAEATAHRIADTTGLPFQDILARMDRFQTVDVKLGLYVVIVGGVIGLIGGLLGLAWVARQDRRTQVADEPLPGDRSTPLPPPEPGSSQIPPT